MTSVLLDKQKHDRDRFDCGVTALNSFLKLTVNQQSVKDNSRTYVIEDKDDSVLIVGFYTLTMVSIRLNTLPAKLQKKHKNNNAAGLIARLAVDKRYAERGLGSWLLADALKKLLNASDTVGFAMVIVDVKDGMESFYERFGFRSFKNEKQKMFMSVADIRMSFEAASL